MRRPYIHGAHALELELEPWNLITVDGRRLRLDASAQFLSVQDVAEGGCSVLVRFPAGNIFDAKSVEFELATDFAEVITGLDELDRRRRDAYNAELVDLELGRRGRVPRGPPSYFSRWSPRYWLQWVVRLCRAVVGLQR